MSTKKKRVVQIGILLTLFIGGNIHAEQIGDMNGDDKIDITEAIISLKIAAGLDPGVPLGTYTKAIGDARPVDVKIGYTFSSDTGTELDGTRYPAPIIRTGQNRCWDDDGYQMVCSNDSGQDGAIMYGASDMVGVHRITDNGTGTTVTDNLTGLTWLRDPNCAQTQYPVTFPNGRMTWQDAFLFVTNINAGIYSDCNGGHSDWRLPNMNELQSLFFLGNDPIRIVSGLPIQPPENWFHFTSTSYPADKSKVVVGSFSSGFLKMWPKVDPYAGAGYQAYVWPVRGGMR